MEKKVVFDFGQVLVRFEPYEIASFYADSEEDRQLLTRVVFDRKYWEKQDAGSITNEEMIAETCADLPKHLHKAAAEIVETWIYHLPLMPGMEELLKELKASGRRLYLLSNIGKTFIAHKDEFPILSYFDGCIFSADVGYIKPAREIFERLCKTYDLAPADCLFVDDNPDNVAAANAFGIHALQFFGDAEELKGRLYAALKD